ncbi:MAG: 6-bladed beta-propeller [Chlorobi bacterium]|nr:6-bladed beta-propeller [Chlorobiota bacterium]
MIDIVGGYMKCLYLLVIVLIGTLACSPIEVGEQKHFDKSKSKMVVKKQFDNFFTLDEKILLRTDNNFFNQVSEVFLHNNDIYIVDTYKARKVLHFNSSGDFVNEIGSLGQGPGQFVQPGLFTIIKNKLVVFDNITLSFVEFNKNYSFIKKHSVRKKLGFFEPQWCQVFQDNTLVCFSPRVDDNGNAIFLFDTDLKYINSFFADEKLMECFHIGGQKNLAVDKNKHIWVAKIFTPEISILDFDGNVIKKIDLSLRDCFFDSSQVANVECGDFDNFYKKKNGKAYINGVYALGDYVLISYFYGGQLFDIYNLQGELVYGSILFKKKFQGFANVSNEKLIFYDIWSDEANADHIGGILYMYNMKR